MKAKTIIVPIGLFLLIAFGQSAQASNGNKSRLKALHLKFMHLFATRPEVKDITRDTIYVLGPKVERRIGQGVVITCENKAEKCAAIYTKYAESGGTVEKPMVEEYDSEGNVVNRYYPQEVKVEPVPNGAGMNVIMNF